MAAELIEKFVVTAHPDTREVIRWDYINNEYEPIESLFEYWKRVDRINILALTSIPPPVDMDTRDAGGYIVKEPNWYLWPDGKVGSHFMDVYVPHLRRLVENVRDSIDLQPVYLFHDSENIPYGVESSDFKQWAGLRYLSQRYRSDPTYAFKKIILRKVRMDSGLNEGVHQVASIEQLHRIVDERVDRHNALHNARHIVDPEWNQLTDALISTYNAAPLKSVDYEPFITARAALDAYNIESRLLTESAVSLQSPVITSTDALKRYAIRNIQIVATNRLSQLTGEPYSWMTLLSLNLYDVSTLIALVTSATEEINKVTDDPTRINAIVEHAINRINGWLLPVTLTTSHTLRPDRKVRLNIEVTGRCIALLQLYMDKPTGYDKLSDSLYTVYPNDDTESGLAIEFTGEGAQSGVFNLTFSNTLPDDTAYTARLTITAERNAPPIVTRYHAIGVVNTDS